MKKISIFGLSRSGKSCYIYAMTKSMSNGIKFHDGTVLSIRTPNISQQLRLNKGFNKMAEEGEWPKGTDERTTYNFNCRIGMENIMPFEIQDYKGGLLDLEREKSIEEEIEEQEKLYEYLSQSSAIVFFISAKVLKGAFLQGNNKCYDDIDFINTMFENYLDRTNNNIVPITIVITMSDVFYGNELEICKNRLKDMLNRLFGRNTSLSIALTSVTLGKNLSDEGGKIIGELHIGSTFGNVHVPILFTLYCLISDRLYEIHNNITDLKQKSSLLSSELRQELNKKAIIRLFNNNESHIRENINVTSNGINYEMETSKKLENQLKMIISSFNPEEVEIFYNGILQQTN
jgi:predicted Holliday junction resolvase-like endonuclease